MTTDDPVKDGSVSPPDAEGNQETSKAKDTEESSEDSQSSKVQEL